MISLSLALEPDARLLRRSYRVLALDGYREPLGGVVVALRLGEGGGSFDARDAAWVRLEVTTHGDGEAYFDWYRPDGVPGEVVTVRVTCMDERAVDVVLEAQIEMPWI
jgi:hypothetical protein